MSAVGSVRSSNPEDEQKIIKAQKKLAKECGLEIIYVKFADAWKYDSGSKLTALTKKVYKEQNGEEIKEIAVENAVPERI